MNQEILRLVDTIHRDKEIDKELVFQALEAAYLSAVKKKLGESETTRVEIDRQTGDYKVFDGEECLNIPDLGRIAASAGKQVLLQKIREAERDVVYDEFVEKAGKLISGIVQRFEGQNIIVNLGRAEGVLPRSEQAPGERFRTGERIKVLIKDIKKNTNRVRITLSRTSPEMVRALFSLEVPEIADKVIEIVEIAREPGYRTKVAVTTYDHNVDCVGACVGVRGSRIKNIVDELFGEKIDIVRWNDSIEVLIMNALKPAEISSMDLDFELKRAKVYVKPDQQSLAIGKRGQNVRLASRLCGWDLDIVTVSDEELEKLRTEEIGLEEGAEEGAGEISASPAAETPGGEGPVEETAGAVEATTGDSVESPPVESSAVDPPPMESSVQGTVGGEVESPGEIPDEIPGEIPGVADHDAVGAAGTVGDVEVEAQPGPSSEASSQASTETKAESEEELKTAIDSPPESPGDVVEQKNEAEKSPKSKPEEKGAEVDSIEKTVEEEEAQNH